MVRRQTFIMISGFFHVLWQVSHWPTSGGCDWEWPFPALLFLIQDQYRNTSLHCSLSLCNQRASSCVPVSHKGSTRILILASMTLQWAFIGCYQVLMVSFVFWLFFWFLFFYFHPQHCRGRTSRSVSDSENLKHLSVGPIICEYELQIDFWLWLFTSINWWYVIVLICMFFSPFIRGQVFDMSRQTSNKDFPSH